MRFSTPGFRSSQRKLIEPRGHLLALTQVAVMVQRRKPSVLRRPRDNLNMAADEQGFPIVSHEVATGADCCGCLIFQVRGDQGDITCNECGAVVRTVPVERASSVMVEMASTETC